MSAGASGKRESVLPETLDWYRQSANWLVGLSSGSLALSLGFSAQLAAAPPWVRWFLVLGLLAFLVATASGVLFYLWLTSYGNQLEKAARELAVPESAPPPHGEPSETAAAAPAASSKDDANGAQAIEHAKRMYALFYSLMLWAFFTGLVCVAVTVCGTVLSVEPAGDGGGATPGPFL